MSTVLFAEIGGDYIPLTDCGWVLWARCGCVVGITLAMTPDGGVVNATEDAAWSCLYEDAEAIEEAKAEGEHMELITNQRWRDEVMGLMRKCPHGNTISDKGGNDDRHSVDG